MRATSQVIQPLTAAFGCPNSWRRTSSALSRTARRSPLPIKRLPGKTRLPACISVSRRHDRVPADRAMIIITQPNATEDQIDRIVARVREFGLDAQISRGASRVIIGVIGTEA